MIDTLAILFSCIMLLVVIFRAIQLDRVIPWFASEWDEKAIARLNRGSGSKKSGSEESGESESRARGGRGNRRRKSNGEEI